MYVCMHAYTHVFLYVCTSTYVRIKHEKTGKMGRFRKGWPGPISFEFAHVTQGKNKPFTIPFFGGGMCAQDFFR
jgi:hypothetical protein